MSAAHDPDPRALRRLVDDPAGDPWLAEHVRAAESTLARARLRPDAVERVEARLDELDFERVYTGVWRALRAPAYACAVLALAWTAWAWSRPATAPAPQVAARPVELNDGTLAARTDEGDLTVMTPVARVLVLPHSQVRVTVAQGGVRILASAGAARILYYDGRTELVAAEPTAPRIAPPPPKALAPRHVRGAPATRGPAPVDAERQSFTAALARVRPAPGEALALLDAHLRRFPDGALRPDAERVRIAVLLRLDRKDDALAALDRMSAPAPELRIDRAELRAEAGRVEEAIADFGAVLVAGDERFTGRALFGRALAREQQGDAARVADDLERFLLLYPRGELADRARLELRRVSR